MVNGMKEKEEKTEIVEKAEAAKPALNKKKKKLSIKGILILAVILLIAAGIIALILFLQARRNDGAAHALELSEEIGRDIQTAQKRTRINLSAASEYGVINQLATDYEYLYESPRSVQVRGVSIPQWVILTDVNGSQIEKVVFYDYRQLHSYGNGTKTKHRITTDGIIPGMDSISVEENLGLHPFCTEYTAGTTINRYKYYYKDKNTSNTVSYTISATFTDNQLQSIQETENLFILNDLH